MVNRIILFTSFLIVISCAKRVNCLDLVDSTNNVANFSFTDSVFIPDYNQYLCFNNQGLLDTTYSYVEYTFCSDPDLRNLQRFSHHTYACEDTVGLGYDFISDDSIQLIDFYSYRSENNELLDSHYLQTQKERFITTKKAQGNTSSQQLYCELRTSCGITYFYSTTPASLPVEKNTSQRAV